MCIRDSRYAVRDEFFDKYLQAVPAGGKTAFQPQPLTGRDELRELEALMRLLRNHGVNALFVMQPLHPMVFRDLDRFTPVQRQVDALCARYAMTCMDMYDAPYEIGTLRDVQPVSYTHLDVYKRQIKKMGDMGVLLLDTTPAQFGQVLARDADKYGKLIKELGITAE